MKTELKQTKALRKEVSGLQNDIKRKKEIEKYFEETVARFDDMHLKYEEESKKQQKMEHQIKVLASKLLLNGIVEHKRM